MFEKRMYSTTLPQAKHVFCSDKRGVYMPTAYVCLVIY